VAASVSDLGVSFRRKPRRLRADLLIDTNRLLLAEAEAARQRTRQIVTRAAASRIKRDEIRERWRHPLAVLPADDPVLMVVVGSPAIGPKWIGQRDVSVEERHRSIYCCYHRPTASCAQPVDSSTMWFVMAAPALGGNAALPHPASPN
jgi:hypothetical protein